MTKFINKKFIANRAVPSPIKPPRQWFLYSSIFDLKIMFVIHFYEIRHVS